jgi:hypothetical protein
MKKLKKVTKKDSVYVYAVFVFHIFCYITVELCCKADQYKAKLVITRSDLTDANKIYPL